MAPSSSADGRGHRPEGRKSPRGGRGRSPSLQRGEHVTPIRVELGLFAQFLAQRGEAPDFHLSAIDDELRRVAGHHENAAAFRSAQAPAKRNWGAPIQSSWLENTW